MLQAESLEHGLLLRGIGPQVAAQERVELLQLMQGWRLGHDDALFLDQVSWRLISLGRIAESAGKLACRPGLIAGKPAPTGQVQALRYVQSLWKPDEA
ncbi:hypothetical protein KU43P_01870 [Pseudomonas sp. KU43P]|nr:hypothetical protein KU43P_01870 [Pseudomonas sp. KU43P]